MSRAKIVMTLLDSGFLVWWYKNGILAKYRYPADMSVFDEMDNVFKYSDDVVFIVGL